MSQIFSVRQRIIAALVTVALVGPAPVTPVALAQAQSAERARSPGKSPVHCDLFEELPEPQPWARSRRGSSQFGPVFAPPPPPPPPPAPPPPAPPPPVSVPSPSIALPAPQAEQAGAATPARIAPQPPIIDRDYPRPVEAERYAGEAVANIQRVADTPVSTFAVDVDTGSYSNVRRMLNQGALPPAEAVRTEEMINYFRYAYPKPADRSAPFSISTDVVRTPWNSDTHLLRIGLRGYDVGGDERPRANLVFLVDVSGSMADSDKLPLVQQSLRLLTDQLRPDDRVSIVVYASHEGVLLDPTSDKDSIRQAVDCMRAGGSTAGESALKTAYRTARKNYDAKGINRIIMATDGDFNVGTSDVEELKAIVAKERESGVTMTMLGFGEGNIRDDVMEGIANVGNGNYAYIDSAMEARKVLVDELSASLFTIAKDVKIQVEFNPAWIKEYRLIGYENRLLAEEDFDNDRIDASEIGAGHQVTALYEIVRANAKGWLPERQFAANRGGGAGEAAAGNSADGLAHIKLRYKLPDGEQSRLIERRLRLTESEMDRAASGDMAFVAAVAAFGQKLRGDKYLGDFAYADIAELANSGGGDGFWQQELRQLILLAK